MPTWKFDLGPLPAEGRSRELWIRHAAGFILFEDVRGYALARLDPTLSEPFRNAAIEAIDDTMYGLMMVLDGVTGQLGDFERRITIHAVIRLSEEDNVVAEEIISDGDEMCMGYHMWMEGYYGNDPVASRRS